MFFDYRYLPARQLEETFSETCHSRRVGEKRKSAFVDQINDVCTIPSPCYELRVRRDNIVSLLTHRGAERQAGRQGCPFKSPVSNDGNDGSISQNGTHMKANPSSNHIFAH